MFSRWRGIAAAVLASGAVTAAQAPALAAAGAAAPAVTIGATSQHPPVGRDVLVEFRGGTQSRAAISVRVTGAASGEVVKLLAQRFPYTSRPVVAGRRTLTSAASTYSFTVTPTLATRYRAVLERSGTRVAASGRQMVYVTNSVRITGVRTCQQPVCRETIHLRNFFPPSSLKSEMGKRIYPYLGVSETGLPKWLRRDAGHARVSRPKRVSASAFTFTVSYKFTVGTGSYWWLWAACVQDTESRNGVGLPGRHVCGEKRFRSTVNYLG